MHRLILTKKKRTSDPRCPCPTWLSSYCRHLSSNHTAFSWRRQALTRLGQWEEHPKTQGITELHDTRNVLWKSLPHDKNWNFLPESISMRIWSRMRYTNWNTNSNANMSTRHLYFLKLISFSHYNVWIHFWRWFFCLPSWFLEIRVFDDTSIIAFWLSIGVPWSSSLHSSLPEIASMTILRSLLNETPTPST